MIHQLDIQLLESKKSVNDLGKYIRRNMIEVTGARAE